MIPSLSWLTLIASLFVRICLESWSIFLRSLLMIRGVASTAQIDIWILFCHGVIPKFPAINMSGSIHFPGPWWGRSPSELSPYHSMILSTDRKESSTSKYSAFNNFGHLPVRPTGSFLLGNFENFEIEKKNWPKISLQKPKNDQISDPE